MTSPYSPFGTVVDPNELYLQLLRNVTPQPIVHSNNRDKKVNKAIMISNLKPTTNFRAVFDAFKQFGHLFSVNINKDENGRSDGTATVEFCSKPRHFNIKHPLKIDDQVVTMAYGKILSEEERPTHCKATSFSLGIMLTPTEFVEEWTGNQRVNLVIFYEKRRMNVEFRHLGVPYVMEIKFGDIENDGVVVENIGSATFLTVRLNQPPKLFEQHKGLLSETRTRVARIPIAPLDNDASFPKLDNMPTLVHATPTDIRIEAWTVFRIKFDPEKKEKQWLRKMLVGMAEYNLVPRDAHFNTIVQLKVTPSRLLPTPKTHQQRSKLLDFDVLYHLECNISANYLVERNLDDKFYNYLSSLDRTVACRILEIMAQQKKRVWNPMETMASILKEDDKRVKHVRRIPPHCAMLRKVLISPTATYFQPLSLETTNRVVRHYKQFADRFIRVQFIDEDFMRLGPAFGHSANESLYARVFRTLKNGIQIGDRRYDYLGYSNSQLREQGCWFYAASGDDSELTALDVDSIRSWMGDFSNITIVAKHAARIGQCFSSTMAIMKLKKEQVEEIDDIIIGDYTFSDGIGNISRGLAKEVSRRMSQRVVPSAFQFRLCGAKGMLMVSDRLQGQKLQLRNSQIKFNSDHYMLEVIRSSSFIPAFLNRQSITLLSTLGVTDGVFMVKLGAVLHALNVMLENPKSAIKTLQLYPDGFGIASFMTRIINAGFLERQDPFIKNLLNVFRLRTLKNLKEKAKLPVEKGAFVFGVVDENNLLKEDEIFCQVTNDTERKRKTVILGKCIVYRNPCFHPGDIRVVTAVDHPKLRDRLTNVVVFPGVGERDIPSMCSGGDLDGDEYTVIWDKTLMPKTINHPPMKLPPSFPKTKSHVTTDDIKEFFVDYIRNDNLGQIANAHLATADSSDDGAFDPRCQELAKLHSVAVDFPKTGNCAEMNFRLRVQRFPDFMCKEDKPRYVSKKVLGQMFQRINKTDYDEYESALVDNQIYDTRLRVDGMERYIARARQSLEKYNLDLEALMNQYGVKTEAEIISGFVMAWTNGCNKKTDYESQKQTMSAMSAMRRLWKKEFMFEFKDAIAKDKAKDKGKKKRDKKRNNKNPSYSKEIELELEAKAAAWYYVTYHPTERDRDVGANKGSYFSFAWVMEDILVRLGKRYINDDRAMNDELMKAVDETLITKYQVNDASQDTQASHNKNDDGDDDLSTIGNGDDDDDDDVDDNDDNDDDDDDDESSVVTGEECGSPSSCNPHNKLESALLAAGIDKTLSSLGISEYQRPGGNRQ